jgi:hypothetical protein
MTIKELAYAAHKHLQTSSNISFKRAHLHELLAASFGFNSYAAFGVDSVFTELHASGSPARVHVALVMRRCMELDYPSETAHLVAAALQSFVIERHVGFISLSSLINSLRKKSSGYYDDLEDENEELSDIADDEDLGPLLMDGLDAAARKHHALAHYALALIHAPSEEDDPDAGNSYWYSQAQQGHVLTGAAKEWAEGHAAHLTRTEKYVRHLREAGRLGNAQALLDLAEQFDDPAFFDLRSRNVDADPAEIAALAERMGRIGDARHWLTLAAEGGDTDAMVQLIEEHDQDDPIRSWTWVHLSRLLGTDITRNDHYAINEDGCEYDDDVGGPVYVGGRSGVDLDPLSAEQDAAAKRAAQELFGRIQR